MRASRMLISTLKEAPNEAVIDSHILLLRAGMIRKMVSGIYNYMPFGLRTLGKIETIIREEMNRTGAIEFLTSALQPRELWDESGRWEKYGAELMRLTDRHSREFCLGPTHEEVFTDIARNIIKSAKNLPINLYQIQTKYRDEVRPRFGLIRGREFIMKDAYSFDKTEADLEISYQVMYDAYCRIFDRLHIHYKVVLADTGAIGGNGSHQFMALSDIGESNILYCSTCGYAADEEKATAVADGTVDESFMDEIQKIHTPKQHTIEEVSNFLGCKPKEVVKTLLYKDNDHQEIIAVLVRGDRDVNEIKVINELGIAEAFFTLANDEEIKHLNTVYGYVGPVGLAIKIFVDHEVAAMKNFYVGANERDYHLANVNFGRDFQGIVGDFRKAVAGDLCPTCHAEMKTERGIEVGQLFKLQTKYSEPMKCTYVDETGKNIPMVMGCYGIGVTRTLSSIVEQHHDEHGIVWPIEIAPYHAVVVPINYDDEAQRMCAEEIYEELNKRGVEVILDDRNAKPGFKFKDWDLIGIPYMIVCGRNAASKSVELKRRWETEKIEINVEEAIELISKELKQ